MPTREELMELREAAIWAGTGDWEQVALCEAALAGDEVALAECARVIADARAQDEDIR